ncbi:IDEAL domain-containing protein [Bacillus sp. Marseille-P3661]|uniref:IDEAL domain-containing protein n=1 Tax=Bacillus sp. Marseille-P3661 TaxID=1936234 RepID=UPI000C842783|nr:IDEAL domain-containing protein [Bacillus sp. Marseille-P3661]
MKNKKSYTEQMKARVTELNRNETNFVLNTYIQMIIDESLFNHEKALLQKQIDNALDLKDRELFSELSEQYNKLLSIST